MRVIAHTDFARPRRTTRVSSHVGRVLIATLLLAIAAFGAGCGGQATSSPLAAKHAMAASKAPAAAEGHVASTGSALAGVARLDVKGRAPRSGYRRKQFGDGWATVDGCDTRDRILNRDLRAKTFRAATNRCVVLSGRLADPYTSTTIQYVRGSAAGVDIDHVVALGDAWQKGAQPWSPRERVAFANDPLNLLAVDASANRQKGDGDTATWLPSNKPFRCTYVARQVSVKLKYAVWVTRAESAAMLRVLVKCPSMRLPAAGRVPITGSSGARVFDSCAAARGAAVAPCVVAARSTPPISASTATATASPASDRGAARSSDGRRARR
jgi:hypothetical protein